MICLPEDVHQHSGPELISNTVDDIFPAVPTIGNIPYSHSLGLQDLYHQQYQSSAFVTEVPKILKPSRLRVYKQFPLWGLKSINSSYFWLFGVLG